MTTKISIFLITTMISLAASLVLAPFANATWYENGTVICAADGIVDDIRVVPDGTGGALLVWEDDRSGTLQIYAQRVDSLGESLWGPDGIAVGPYAAIQAGPDIVADGTGGAFIVWNDYRNGTSDIYGQNLDGEGTAQWPDEGLPICVAVDTQLGCRAEADGFGGLVVVWQDARAGSSDIYGQRVDASGTPDWTINGLAMAGTGGTQIDPILAVIPGADEASTRVMVTWIDGRNFGTAGFDIYLQRLTLDGTLQWGAYGVPAFSGSLDDYDQFPKRIEPSIGGGFILSWEDYRNGVTNHDRGFGIHRFDRYGNHVGTPILYYGYDPKFTVEPDGGYVAAYTNVSTTPRTFGLAYKKDASGNFLWSEYLHDQFWESLLGGTDVASDGSGGGVFCYYLANGSSQHLYAQRIRSGGGGLEWGTPGVPLCTDVRERSELQIVALDGESALVVWKDERHAPVYSGDLYAQRVDIGFRTWGQPLPVILAVEDEPDDEGGWVRLRTRASDHDSDQTTGFPILGYNVWRLVEVAKGAGGEPAKGSVCETLADFEALVEAGKSTVGIRPGPGLADELGMKSYEWESLGFHAAIGLDEYLFVVPTRTDSTAAGIPWEHYSVWVHTADGSGAWGSDTASGYSVDNLAPEVLTGLRGHASWDPAGLDLTWEPSLAGDLAHYVVHRGLNASFVPDGTNRLATMTQPGHLDGGWSSGEGFHYKVAAVDRHGNVGSFALLEPGEVSASDTPPVSGLPHLMQNIPNPFNPRTTITFVIPDRMAVDLEIYDVAGRLVDVVLDDEVVSRGRYEVVWWGENDRGQAVPAGIYFYRLVADRYTETKRMVLVR